jgi:hypothetical protein
MREHFDLSVDEDYSPHVQARRLAIRPEWDQSQTLVDEEAKEQS